VAAPARDVLLPAAGLARSERSPSAGACSRPAPRSCSALYTAYRARGRERGGRDM